MGFVAILAAVLAVAWFAREMMWRSAHAALRERLRAAATDVREEERRAHVTQVVSGLAQELKSPLQGVLGNTELMLASGSLSAASTNDLRQIQEHAARAAGIVRNLLAFTETQALSRRWQDINELAIRAADTVRGELGPAGVQVKLALADRLPLMYVDGRQLEKVIATLLLRPVGRTDASAGTLTLATRRGATDDRLVIELDDRAREDDEPEWSGDLEACRQIVHAHGGTLEVERHDIGGFRFHVELPVTAIDADTAAAS
jgi:two-component system, NtrC family, sensor kinase